MPRHGKQPSSSSYSEVPRHSELAETSSHQSNQDTYFDVTRYQSDRWNQHPADAPSSYPGDQSSPSSPFLDARFAGLHLQENVDQMPLSMSKSGEYLKVTYEQRPFLTTESYERLERAGQGYQRGIAHELSSSSYGDSARLDRYIAEYRTMTGVAIEHLKAREQQALHGVQEWETYKESLQGRIDNMGRDIQAYERAIEQDPITGSSLAPHIGELYQSQRELQVGLDNGIEPKIQEGQMMAAMYGEQRRQWETARTQVETQYAWHVRQEARPQASSSAAGGSWDPESSHGSDVPHEAPSNQVREPKTRSAELDAILKDATGGWTRSQLERNWPEAKKQLEVSDKSGKEYIKRITRELTGRKLFYYTGPKTEVSELARETKSKSAELDEILKKATGGWTRSRLERNWLQAKRELGVSDESGKKYITRIIKEITGKSVSYYTNAGKTKPDSYAKPKTTKSDYVKAMHAREDAKARDETGRGAFAMRMESSRKGVPYKEIYARNKAEWQEAKEKGEIEQLKERRIEREKESRRASVIKNHENRRFNKEFGEWIEEDAF